SNGLQLVASVGELVVFHPVEKVVGIRAHIRITSHFRIARTDFSKGNPSGKILKRLGENKAAGNRRVKDASVGLGERGKPVVPKGAVQKQRILIRYLQHPVKRIYLSLR